MMGLGAVAASSTACSGGSGDDGAGGEGAGVDDGDGNGYPSAVSTYGVGPSSTTQSSSSGGDACGTLDDGTPCGGCVELSCCAEGLACADSLPCAEAGDCLDACDPNDLACATACQEANPEGFTLQQALRQCLGESCEQECLAD
jgi:hypothetical protein